MIHLALIMKILSSFKFSNAVGLKRIAEAMIDEGFSIFALQGCNFVIPKGLSIPSVLFKGVTLSFQTLLMRMFIFKIQLVSFYELTFRLITLLQNVVSLHSLVSLYNF